jgi:hypothetical protein
LDSVIHLFAERQPRLSRISPELDKFNESRCRMLEAFTALAASNPFRPMLTDQMLDTVRVTRDRREILGKDAANAR